VQGIAKQQAMILCLRALLLYAVSLGCSLVLMALFTASKALL